MRVRDLWRFPVKSVGGERLEAVAVTELGIDGDRAWGLVDDTTGNVLTARREPRLLMATATIDDGAPVVTPIEGGELRTGAELSAWLDRPVTLAAAGAQGGTYENPLDPFAETDWVSWQGPPGAWHDSGRSRVSIVSTGSLAGWDVRRFRTNVVIDGEGEDDLVDRRIRLGAAELEVTKRISRCVMVTRPQPGLDRDLTVLKTVHAERNSCLSIGAVVSTPGTIRLGDELTVR